jgi:hypothetical protein
VVLNQNGFCQAGSAIIPSPRDIKLRGKLLAARGLQQTASGDFITVASAPSVGFSVFPLPKVKITNPVTVSIDDQSATLSNGLLTATVMKVQVPLMDHLKSFKFQEETVAIFIHRTGVLHLFMTDMPPKKS